MPRRDCWVVWRMPWEETGQVESSCSIKIQSPKLFAPMDQPGSAHATLGAGVDRNKKEAKQNKNETPNGRK